MQGCCKACDGGKSRALQCGGLNCSGHLAWCTNAQNNRRINCLVSCCAAAWVRHNGSHSGSNDKVAMCVAGGQRRTLLFFRSPARPCCGLTCTAPCLRLTAPCFRGLEPLRGEESAAVQGLSGAWRECRAGLPKDLHGPKFTRSWCELGCQSCHAGGGCVRAQAYVEGHATTMTHAVIIPGVTIV